MRDVIIIMKLEHRRKWKSCGMYWSSSSYNIGGSGKVAVCNNHHLVITQGEVEKLRYVMIIIKLQNRRKWKSCGM